MEGLTTGGRKVENFPLEGNKKGTRVEGSEKSEHVNQTMRSYRPGTRPE